MGLDVQKKSTCQRIGEGFQTAAADTRKVVSDASGISAIAKVGINTFGVVQGFAPCNKSLGLLPTQSGFAQTINIIELCSIFKSISILTNPDQRKNGWELANAVTLLAVGSLSIVSFLEKMKVYSLAPLRHEIAQVPVLNTVLLVPLSALKLLSLGLDSASQISQLPKQSRLISVASHVSELWKLNKTISVKNEKGEKTDAEVAHYKHKFEAAEIAPLKDRLKLLKGKSKTEVEALPKVSSILEKRIHALSSVQKDSILTLPNPKNVLEVVDHSAIPANVISLLERSKKSQDSLDDGESQESIGIRNEFKTYLKDKLNLETKRWDNWTKQVKTDRNKTVLNIAANVAKAALIILGYIGAFLLISAFAATAPFMLIAGLAISAFCLGKVFYDLHYNKQHKFYTDVKTPENVAALEKGYLKAAVAA